MQEALGGKSVAKILTCLGPTMKMYFNTYHALNFASKSRHVVNKPFSAAAVEVKAGATTTATTATAAAAAAAAVQDSQPTQQHGPYQRGKRQATTGGTKPLPSATTKAPGNGSKSRDSARFAQRGAATRSGAKDDVTKKLEQRVQQLEQYMTDVMLAQMTTGQQQQQQPQQPQLQQQQQQEDALGDGDAHRSSSSQAAVHPDKNATHHHVADEPEVVKATFSESMTQEQRVTVAK